MYDFPDEKVFEKIEEERSYLTLFLRLIQWVSVFGSAAIMVGYAILCLSWFVLGAIINPEYFLPYASGALTFITFVYTKFQQLKLFEKSGREAILAFLEGLRGDLVNKVTQFLSNKIEGTTRAVAEKTKDLIKSPVFQNVSQKLIDAGVLEERDIKDLNDKIDSLDARTIVNTTSLAITNPNEFLHHVDDLIDDVVKFL